MQMILRYEGKTKDHVNEMIVRYEKKFFNSMDKIDIKLMNNPEKVHKIFGVLKRFKSQIMFLVENELIIFYVGIEHDSMRYFGTETVSRYLDTEQTSYVVKMDGRFFDYYE